MNLINRFLNYVNSARTEKAEELKRCLKCGELNFADITVDAPDRGVRAYSELCKKLSNGLTKYQQKLNKIKTDNNPNYKEKKSQARPLLNAVIQQANKPVGGKWSIIEHGKALCDELDKCATSAISKRSVLSDPGIKAIFAQLQDSLNDIVDRYVAAQEQERQAKLAQLQTSGKEALDAQKKRFMELKENYETLFSQVKVVFTSIGKLLKSANSLYSKIGNFDDSYSGFYYPEDKFPSGVCNFTASTAAGVWLPRALYRAICKGECTLDKLDGYERT